MPWNIQREIDGELMLGVSVTREEAEEALKRYHERAKGNPTLQHFTNTLSIVEVTATNAGWMDDELKEVLGFGMGLEADMKAH